MYEQKLSENGKHVDLIGLAVSMAGCGRAAVDGPYSAASAAGTSTTSQLALDGNFDRFDLERFTRKIWEGDTVYFETICFMEQEDGSIVSGTLLYAPDKILSVRSHNLQTVYEEGKVTRSAATAWSARRIPASRYSR